MYNTLFKKYTFNYNMDSDTFRVKIGYTNKKWIVLSQPKMCGATKQQLYKCLKDEFELKRIYIRRNSVVCVE